MNTQYAPYSMSLPPPRRPDLDLLDGNRFVGWVRGSAVGFRGFANESEAAGAAWVAHRALARRLADRHGGRPEPTGVEPLALDAPGDRVMILAGGQPIATLVGPGDESLSGPDSFGFEIQVPVPADELFMRSLAYRIYRRLRNSGARWAMWENRRVDAAPHRTGRPEGIRLRGADSSDQSMRERGWLAVGVVSITVLLLALVVPDELAVAFAAIGLAGLVVFRLTAAWVGWVPDRRARGESRSGQSAPRQEPTSERFSSRSNGARPMPRQRTAGEAQQETSPRLLPS